MEATSSYETSFDFQRTRRCIELWEAQIRHNTAHILFASCEEGTSVWTRDDTYISRKSVSQTVK
jgi:hypothetical protein